MLQTRIDAIRYGKGKLQDTTWHQDTYSLFGTAVCIIRDTVVGRLRIEVLDAPEVLEPGSIVFLDPACVHRVTYGEREADREVVTIVL